MVFGGDAAVLSGHLIAPAAVAAMTLEAGDGRSRRRASDIHMFAILKNEQMITRCTINTLGGMNCGSLTFRPLYALLASYQNTNMSSLISDSCIEAVQNVEGMQLRYNKTENRT
jgi:hypothetical protein